MPTYDYVCNLCGHRFEVIHGVNAAGPTHCPVCHKGPVRKAFALPTIHFKGSGWAKKDRGTAARAAAKDKAGVGSGSDGASDKTKGGASNESPSKGGDSSSGASDPGSSAKSSSDGASSPGGGGSSAAAD
jgi:putative FmdB family regulatory protein